MPFSDRTLVCVTCEAVFIWGADEQARYASSGLLNQPRRCRVCRRSARAAPLPRPRRPTKHHSDEDALAVILKRLGHLRSFWPRLAAEIARFRSRPPKESGGRPESKRRKF